MPYCTLPDNTKIYFEIYGNELDLSGDVSQVKPTIVALHGGPDADHTFHIPFYKNCSEFSQVIMFDHRGCGRSDASDTSKWNLKQWAQDVQDFCRILNLDQPYISGISFGGVVAMQHAILYSQYIKGLILIDTEASFNKDELLEAFQTCGGEKVRRIAEDFYENASPENAEMFVTFCVPLFTRKPFPMELYKFCHIRPEVAAHYRKNELLTVNLLSELSKVKVPVLYINGTINPMHRKSNAERTAKAFINANLQLELLSGDGFTTIDNPELVASKIHCFIEKGTTKVQL